MEAYGRVGLQGAKSPALASNEKTVEQCGSHLGELLKASKKNGQPLRCARGAECKYKHGRIRELTRVSAKALVSTMPAWMQDRLSKYFGMEIRGERVFIHLCVST